MTPCQVCNENEARIHVTDVTQTPTESGEDFGWTEQHLCQGCAEKLDLPNVPGKPQIHQIWQLLGAAQKSPKQPDTSTTCPHCGMTLAEFRAKGRLGCPHDYEVFADHLMPLLERIHNASEHVGRMPAGIGAPTEPDRKAVLESELEAAIADEDYERAAALRDQLRDASDSEA